MKILKDINKNWIQLNSNNKYLATFIVKAKPRCLIQKHIYITKKYIYF